MKELNLIREDINEVANSEIQNKLAEFFETEQALSKKSYNVYCFLEENKHFILETGISEDYLGSIIEAYFLIIDNPYLDFYNPEDETYQRANDQWVPKEQLTNEDIAYLAGKIREKNRVLGSSYEKDETLRKRLGAQAFISLHIGTIERFLSEIKSVMPEELKDTLTTQIRAAFGPVQRPTRVSMLFNDLVSLMDIDAFRSMKDKSQNFTSDIEFLLDLGEVMLDKEALANIIRLEHLIDAAEMGLEFSVLGAPAQKEESDDFLCDFLTFGSEATDELQQSINLFKKQLEVDQDYNVYSSLEKDIKNFMGRYIAWLDNDENLEERNLEHEIFELKLKFNSIMQKTLAEYICLFDLQDRNEFKVQFKKIRIALDGLKEFLIEQGFPLSKTSSLRTIKAGINKHLNFILNSTIGPDSNKEIEIDLGSNDEKIQNLIPELAKILGVDDFDVEIKGKGTYGTYYCITIPSGIQYGVKINSDLDALKDEARFDGRIYGRFPYGNYEFFGENDNLIGFNIIPHHKGEPADKVDFAALQGIKKLKFLRGILFELRDLHSMGILHRDLKLDNIIYEKETGQVKIIDFGRSVFMSEMEDEKFLLNRNNGIFRGVHLRLQPQVAPEHYTLDYPITYSADYYSLFNVIQQVFPELITKEPFLSLNAEDPKGRPPISDLIGALELEITSELDLELENISEHNLLHVPISQLQTAIGSLGAGIKPEDKELLREIVRETNNLSAENNVSLEEMQAKITAYESLIERVEQKAEENGTLKKVLGCMGMVLGALIFLTAAVAFTVFLLTISPVSIPTVAVATLSAVVTEIVSTVGLGGSLVGAGVTGLVGIAGFTGSFFANKKGREESDKAQQWGKISEAMNEIKCISSEPQML